ncbi:MAG: glutamine--tRNA ligase [Gemmataceae bacterium]
MRHNKSGRFGGRVHTRFPPEPNGYLHISRQVHLPELRPRGKVRWQVQPALRRHQPHHRRAGVRRFDSRRRPLARGQLGRSRVLRLRLRNALRLGREAHQEGKAYVDDLPPEKMAEYRGDVKGGKPRPYRDRSVEENLDLFRRMKAGEFPEGKCTLRAKIDMNHPNFHLRDPIMYRIMHAKHHRTGDKWCIYPMYDYAHGESDSIEGITHSICTLEFEIHRPLYDWYIDAIGIPKPQQIEFARLNLTYTVLSKRKLIQLVTEKHVSGWDDPRMPTIVGIRRRGYTPEAMWKFCERIGVSKYNGLIDVAWLEDALREDLNKKAPRVMGVLRPLKVVIENYPDGQTEQMDAINNPEDASAGTRKVPFSKVLYIEQDDFRENPPKDFFRLAPGKEVRLRYAYFVKCTSVVKDAAGNVTEVRCTYDPATRGGDSPDGRKVKGTIHWVDAATALDCEVRLYDHLFAKPDPDDVPEGQTFLANLNPKSLEIVNGCKLEPSVAGSPVGKTFQFERLGYFCVDRDSAPGKLVFNRAVTLRDTWAKIEKKGK